MSTDLNMVLTLTEPAIKLSEHNLKALKPATAMRRTASNNTNRLSNTALWLVILAHVLALLAILNAPKSKPLEIDPPKPMMVSLLSAPAPEPEVVPLLPTPPKPEPVIKKQKPIVREVKPTPQPVQEAPAPVVQETSAPVAPAPQPVVAKAPEVKPEPEKPPVKQDIIEEPKFGVAYLNNPAPNYPPMSRRIGEEGRVLMRVLVSVNGDPETVTIETSSGSDRLDKAAIEAVKKWRFVPAKKNRQPISAYVLVPIKFSLDDA
ncbi:MAG TPA: energy transducer TonB [Methylophilaceae bacterium]|nr:energy transducer TonB [Methylophilaceae bacterium]